MNIIPIDLKTRYKTNVITGHQNIWFHNCFLILTESLLHFNRTSSLGNSSFSTDCTVLGYLSVGRKAERRLLNIGLLNV